MRKHRIVKADLKHLMKIYTGGESITFSLGIINNVLYLLMKQLKVKLSNSDWYKNIMKKSNYAKFIKTTLIERRKQLKINKTKNS